MTICSLYYALKQTCKHAVVTVEYDVDKSVGMRFDDGPSIDYYVIYENVTPVC